ncbi:MAG: prepilin-type N-terminal cleavage/methylation domain-containing protein [Planctomycetota bacterium]
MSHTTTVPRLAEPATEIRATHAGLTLLECVVTIALVSVVLGGVVYAIQGSQFAYLENELASRVTLRAQNAMDRISQMAGQALSIDPQFSPLFPTTGINSHCLQFRIIESAAGGTPVYDDDLRVFIWGPDAGPPVCSGLVIGRGPDQTQIFNAAAGGDAELGTSDDVTSATLFGGVPAVEVLLTDEFAPRTGEMFTVTVSPAPVGRLLTFTLRLNARRSRGGDFVFNTDIVITERVALYQ